MSSEPAGDSELAQFRAAMGWDVDFSKAAVCLDACAVVAVCFIPGAPDVGLTIMFGICTGADPPWTTYALTADQADALAENLHELAAEVRDR